MSRKQIKQLRKIVLALVLFAVLLISEKAGMLPVIFDHRLISFCLYLIPYLIVGLEVLRKAALGVKNRQPFDECFLMTIATIGAFATGENSEAVAVMVFYQVGEWFQSYAVGKSRESITELMNIVPEYANLEQQDGTVEEIDPDDVEIGNILVIRPGEKIPVDGTVLTGSGMIDTAALTGESVPRSVHPGEQVISGCINGEALLRIRAEKVFEDSTVAKILELVENASEKKSRTESFITRFARWYTPIVVIAALALAIIPSIITLKPSVWIYRACTFLVISCPCALVISVPLSFFGGIGAASKIGVLVKGSNYLEQIAQLSVVVTDKTGTLTEGNFRVSAVCPAAGVSREELLRVAAMAESTSTHPIALSILEAYREEFAAAGIESGEETDAGAVGTAVGTGTTGIAAGEAADAAAVKESAGACAAGTVAGEAAGAGVVVSAAGEAMGTGASEIVTVTVAAVETAETGNAGCQAENVFDVFGMDIGAESILHEQDTGVESILREQDTGAESILREQDTGAESILREQDTGAESILREQDTGAESILCEQDIGSESILHDTDITDVENISGRGLRLRIGGSEVLAGNAQLLADAGIACPAAEDPAATVVYIAAAMRYLGMILIRDQIKDGSKEAVVQMKSAGVDTVVMLTGDRSGVAEAVGREVGVDRVYSELLPHQKVEQVEKLLDDLHRTSGKRTLAFLGDGINDAPVLSRADIGIAMGSLGSDAAIEAADIVIMDDDLRRIPAIIRIAGRTVGICRQNIVFALAVKDIILVLGALGIANMWAAVFADVGVAILCILNAMRVLYNKA